LVYTFLAKLLLFIPLPDVQKCNNTVQNDYNKKFILFLTQFIFLPNCVGEKKHHNPNRKLRLWRLLIVVERKV